MTPRSISFVFQTPLVAAPRSLVAKVLAEYLAAFHPSFVGLTGSPEQIRKVANSYKAFYVKMPGEHSGEYSIDHTGAIYLMGRGGEYLGFMPPQTSPDRLTEVLRKNLAR